MTDRMLDEDNHIDATSAPLIEHLTELRSRLIWVLAGMLVTFLACFYFSDHIFKILVWPYDYALSALGINQRVEIQITAPHELFLVYLKLGLFGAIFLSFPIFAIQIYRFVAPGLYQNERGAFYPYLIATPVLFILGAALVHFIVMPLAMQFFLNMLVDDKDLIVKMMPRASEYLSFVMALILAFGICFQMPVVLTLMARAGMLTADALRRNRKYAVVGVFAVAAFLTPPDLISQIGLAIPTLLLYEASILSVHYLEREREEVMENE